MRLPAILTSRPEEIEQVIAEINASGATVLLVGLGGGRQEKFIFRYRDRLPGINCFLPLGGTIDYEAESLKRPPAWITNIGLEWFYRLCASHASAGSATLCISRRSSIHCASAAGELPQSVRRSGKSALSSSDET